MSREIAFDCRHFQGDRPCFWHKREGKLCACDRYEPVQSRVLIIKLDAMGDVLRTTGILPPLAAANPDAAITWITRAESKPLLANNPYLSEIVTYGPDAMVHLSARTFDRVINLDAGKISAGLASAARSARKDGYLLQEAGYVTATNHAARLWLEMGIFDDLKSSNARTYQSFMADIVGVDESRMRYVFELREAENARAKDHFRQLGLDLNAPIVGLNTGAGGRWQFKQWRLDGYLELITRLHDEMGVQLVLLGGKPERSRHEWLREKSRGLVRDAGNDNDVRHFGALISQCSVIVSGDTLAMHLAISTQRRVVVLFGPTSSAEIDLYGLGEKVIPELKCLACYRETCDLVPNCMDLIGVGTVVDAVRRQLSAVVTPGLSSSFRRKG